MPITKINPAEETIKGELQYIPLKNIFAPKIKAREWVNPERVKEIAISATSHGILQPILLSPIPDQKDRYYLVYGQHRIDALKYIKKHGLDITYKDFFPLDAIKAEVRKLTPAQRLEIALLENENREDQNPIDKTMGIMNLIKMELTDIFQSEGLDCECDDEYVRIVLQRIVARIRYKRKNKQLKKLKLGVYDTENISVPVTRYENGIPEIDREATQAILDTFNLTAASFAEGYLPLLLMCPDVIHAIQTGWIGYAKGRVINQVLNDKNRLFLIDLVHKTDIKRSAIYKMIKIPEGSYSDFIKQLKDENLIQDRQKLDYKKITAINKRIEEIAESFLQVTHEDIIKREFTTLMNRVKQNKTLWGNSQKMKELNVLMAKINKLMD